MDAPAPKTPSQRYADWFAKHRERVLAYKRQYYASHPEFAERKRQRALERYMNKGCVPGGGSARVCLLPLPGWHSPRLCDLCVSCGGGHRGGNRQGRGRPNGGAQRERHKGQGGQGGTGEHGFVLYTAKNLLT